MAIGERTMRIVVGLLAAGHIVLGLYMAIDPGGFFDKIGMYGQENQHYVGDLGAVYLAYGVALALAVTRSSWRAPLLGFGALWYGLHALNHLGDIDEAESDAHGIADTLLIAAGALFLGWLARAAERINGERA